MLVAVVLEDDSEAVMGLFGVLLGGVDSDEVEPPVLSGTDPG